MLREAVPQILYINCHTENYKRSWKILMLSFTLILRAIFGVDYGIILWRNAALIFYSSAGDADSSLLVATYSVHLSIHIRYQQNAQ